MVRGGGEGEREERKKGEEEERMRSTKYEVCGKQQVMADG